ncbi:MAG TPA: DUF2207 domain-containing protein [Chloroflexota bacterium]|nr:DUF2207 domain-containing protein [Chloroflexota bacterium]
MIEVLVALALFLALATPVHAQSAGQATTNRSARALRYDVDLQLQQDGRLVVREAQEIAFTGGPFQKGSRWIPLSKITRLSDVRVAIDGAAASGGREFPGTFDVTGDTVGPSVGRALIEWWFPRTTNARRTFVLDYTVAGAVSYYDAGDQLRWNALYGDRPYPIESSTITLRLPSPTSEWRADAYPRSLLRADPVASGAVVTWRAAGLDANQPLEIRAQWPHGMIVGSPPPWQEAADREAYRRESLRPVLNVAFAAAALLVAFAGGLAVFLTWYARGRDPQIGAVPDELDAPPSDLSPALAGTVVDERADVQDVVATLLHLAVRGVVSIGEVIEQRPFGTQRDFELALVDRAKANDQFEEQLLDTLFRGGNQVRLSRVGDWFGTYVPRLQAALHAEAHRAGLFSADPEVVRRRYHRVGTLLMGAAVVFGIGACVVVDSISGIAAWPFIALLLVGAVLRFAAGAMPQRTAFGALEAARWQAFARYLRRTGATAWRDADPETISESDRLLPYAVALGAEREWVPRLATANAPEPRWIRRGPPVIVMGGPWGGPLGPMGPMGPYGPYGGGRGDGRRRGPGTPAPGGGSLPDAPTVGDNPLERGSNSLWDLIRSASDAMGKGGSGGWSGGGMGGGSFGGGMGGGGGGGGGFE